MFIFESFEFLWMAWFSFAQHHHYTFSKMITLELERVNEHCCWCFGGILIIVFLYSRAQGSLCFQTLAVGCLIAEFSGSPWFHFRLFIAAFLLSSVEWAHSISHFTMKKCLLIGLLGKNPGQVPSSRDYLFIYYPRCLIQKGSVVC